MSVNLTTYFHTLRYLRPVQVYGRLWFHFYKPSLTSASSLSLRARSGIWQPAVRRAPSQHAPTGFRFLNQTHELQSTDDWNNPAWGKLWLYNLHYFDDLNARDAERRRDWHRALIDRWIEENPPVGGNGWEPYPLSLRVVNWVKWALTGNRLESLWLESLAVQVRWLRRRLEWHLLGNHLFANAKALSFAGLYFEGPEAEDWLNEGLRIVRREVPEQVLPDGGHFERSPMYHAIILEDLLDLINLDGVYPGVIPNNVVMDWNEAVQRMRRWLAAMVHPDGDISYFNDAAFGIAPKCSALEGYARGMGLPAIPSPHDGLTHLADSGYVRLQRGVATALLDVGLVGPDYLPGHAHADTLSFELSLFKSRVIVNSGISCYGAGADRQRQRSTAAHNTVELDREDSSEVWGGFRVARRARPFDLAIVESGDEILVCCAHDGYQRLRGRPLHRREWCLAPKRLVVRDHIEGHFRQAVARFFLHPDIATEIDGLKGEIVLPEGQRISWRMSGGSVRVLASHWHPEFGLSIPNRCLEVHFIGPKCEAVFAW